MTVPTFLGDTFPSVFRGRPPRLAEPESSIYTRFSLKIPSDVVASFFDVGLGPGKPAPLGTEENLLRMWLRNTQKRADVVLQFRDKVAIIELRTVAQSSAVGRLLLYKMLYLQDPVLGSNVELWLVTDLQDDEVEVLSNSQNIKYIVV
jgi:hypothetical protein